MDRWAAEIGTAEDVYVGKRLSYRDSVSEGDAAFGAYEGGYVLKLLFRTWLIASVVSILVWTFLAGMAEEDPFGGGRSYSEANNAAFFCWIILFILAGLIRERQWASQWEMVLDDKAGAADIAYERIADTIERRQLPLTVEERPIQPHAAAQLRLYLVLSFKEYSAYVGVFPFGTSLFMTWSMWRDQRTWGVIGTHIRDTLSGNSHFDQVIHADPARAMRDAVHNAVREGLEVAAGETSADIDVRDRTAANPLVGVPGPSPQWSSTDDSSPSSQFPPGPPPGAFPS